MELSSLKIGILHSLIGKNDGVSIVIDQTVKAMVEYMNIPLGNIYFLAAHAPSRFNTMLDEIFWHKNEANKYILEYFSRTPPKGFEEYIMNHALYAKQVISNFIDKYNIDLLIAHNTSHPYNFVGAVGLGLYLEEKRNQGVIWPRCLLWWHDSYFEREKFKNPNNVIKKFLKYLPGEYIDGIVFINSQQEKLARRYYQVHKKDNKEIFFERKTCCIPNTCDIPWEWEKLGVPTDKPLHPPQDQYNRSFFKDVGLLSALSERGYSLDDAVILLQHTRIVPRKRIDVAIDFSFMLEKKYREEGLKKCIVLLISGHSGDEQGAYREFLEKYYLRKKRENPESNVVLLFGEHIIYPSREIIVDRKFYKFYEIPSIIASVGGMGTYFSEVEGFGNNLLEMMSMGLPVVINKYEVYKTDIEHLGFWLPATENCVLTEELIEECFTLLTDYKKRNELVRHNLAILKEKLDHRLIAEKLTPLLHNIFKYL